MSTPPACPVCGLENTYFDGEQYVCPDCTHEWSLTDTAEATESERVIKDLKVKGSSSVVKVGTKVKNIRLVDGDHDIDCKIDGIGQMGLKSQFVKKA